MTEAIFGLLGVVIGALISGGMQLMMSVRAEGQETRAASRLTDAELAPVEMALHAKETSGDWSGIRPSDFRSEEWHRHKAAFARLLTGAEWTALAECHTAIQFLQWVGAELELVEQSDETKVRRRDEEAAVQVLARGAELRFLRDHLSGQTLKAVRQARSVLARRAETPAA